MLVLASPSTITLSSWSHGKILPSSGPKFVPQWHVTILNSRLEQTQITTLIQSAACKICKIIQLFFNLDFSLISIEIYRTLLCCSLKFLILPFYGSVHRLWLSIATLYNQPLIWVSEAGSRITPQTLSHFIQMQLVPLCICYSYWLHWMKGLQYWFYCNSWSPSAFHPFQWHNSATCVSCRIQFPLS